MISYIGITDFTDFEQVQSMLVVFNRSLPDRSRKLHIGVMMSYKTLHAIPSRWGNVFPKKENIGAIFSSDEVYNCLHYADYDDHPDLGISLTSALEWGTQGVLHAIQLDMIWPNPDEIARALYRFPMQKIEVILQIGKYAFKKIGNDPQQLILKLAGYEGIIDRVLLDKSMGHGEAMNALELLPYARAIRERFPQLGIGAAGGLGPETTHLALPLINEFPDISLDAQGKLRPSGSAFDPIDWDMARKYLVRVCTLFQT